MTILKVCFIFLGFVFFALTCFSQSEYFGVWYLENTVLYISHETMEIINNAPEEEQVPIPLLMEFMRDQLDTEINTKNAEYHLDNDSLVISYQNGTADRYKIHWKDETCFEGENSDGFTIVWLIEDLPGERIKLRSNHSPNTWKLNASPAALETE